MGWLTFVRHMAFSSCNFPRAMMSGRFVPSPTPHQATHGCSQVHLRFITQEIERSIKTSACRPERETSRLDAARREKNRARPARLKETKGTHNMEQAQDAHVHGSLYQKGGATPTRRFRLWIFKYKALALVLRLVVHGRMLL